MAPIPGAVVVTGFLGPSDSADTYAVTDDTYNKGGFRVVADNTARDAITADRRKEGMFVYNVVTNEWYQLIGGITNPDWTLVNFGAGIDPDPSIWNTNRIQTVMLNNATFPFPAGANAYNNGWLYVNYASGTVLTTQWPNYLCRISTPVAAIPRLVFGSEMNGGIMDWVAEGFGIGLDGNMTAPNFTASAKFTIGWKDWGVVTKDASDYIAFEKKQGDIKLYASVSTAATGGHHFTVDTGLTWDQDYVNKYEILIDPTLMTADFYRDDVLVAHIDSDDVAWPDANVRPWAFEGNGDMALIDWPILYQFPWLVSMKK